MCVLGICVREKEKQFGRKIRQQSLFSHKQDLFNKSFCFDKSLRSSLIELELPLSLALACANSVCKTSFERFLSNGGSLHPPLRNQLQPLALTWRAFTKQWLRRTSSFLRRSARPVLAYHCLTASIVSVLLSLERWLKLLSRFRLHPSVLAVTFAMGSEWILRVSFELRNLTIYSLNTGLFVLRRRGFHIFHPYIFIIC